MCPSPSLFNFLFVAKLVLVPGRFLAVRSMHSEVLSRLSKNDDKLLDDEVLAWGYLHGMGWGMLRKNLNSENERGNVSDVEAWLWLVMWFGCYTRGNRSVRVGAHGSGGPDACMHHALPQHSAPPPPSHSSACFHLPSHHSSCFEGRPYLLVA